MLPIKLSGIVTDILLIHLQFYDRLERDGAAKATLEYRSVTVFAPTNKGDSSYCCRN